MDPVAEFLARQNRQRCERLSADITKETCTTNKTGGRIGVCATCPGLGEGTEMSKNEKSAKNTCVVEGCGKFRVIGDKCTRHGKAVLPDRSPVPEEEVEKVPVVLVEEVSPEVVEQEDILVDVAPGTTGPGRPSLGEMEDALEELFNKKRDVYVKRLTVEKSVLGKAQKFIELCAALENL